MGRKGQKQKAVNPRSQDEIPGPDSPRFDNFKNLAYGGIIAVFGIAVSVNGFASMWAFPSTLGEQMLFVGRVTLFVVFVLLAYRWVIATHNELDMWLLWLDNPIQKNEVYSAMFSLSVVLGLSVAFPHRVVFITFFITFYFLIVYWAQWLANDHFTQALLRTRKRHLNQTKSEVLKAMDNYWLQRPQLARIATMMFFSGMAFSLALAGNYQAQPGKTRFQLAAYVLLILNILLGEAVITWWRHKRDQRIEDITKS
jgi:hypothetical protein